MPPGEKGASGGNDCRLHLPTVVDTERGRKPRTTKCHWGQNPPGMDRKAHRPKPWQGQYNRGGRTCPRHHYRYTSETGLSTSSSSLLPEVDSCSGVPLPGTPQMC